MGRASSWLLLAVGLAGSACSDPEGRVARRYLRCVGDGDLTCLRRYLAPVLPRLRAWSASPKADELFIGPYTRKALTDADNPFAAVAPRGCQKVLAAGVSAQLRDKLGRCACRVVARRALPEREARSVVFEPARVAAGKRHPALEVLSNRTTAEALRASSVTHVRCDCAGSPVEVGLLDQLGRESPVRVFHASGLCAAPEASAVDLALRRASELLSAVGLPGPRPTPAEGR